MSGEPPVRYVSGIRSRRGGAESWRSPLPCEANDCPGCGAAPSRRGGRGVCYSAESGRPLQGHGAQLLGTSRVYVPVSLPRQLDWSKHELCRQAQRDRCLEVQWRRWRGGSRSLQATDAGATLPLLTIATDGSFAGKQTFGSGQAKGSVDATGRFTGTGATATIKFTLNPGPHSCVNGPIDLSSR